LQKTNNRTLPKMTNTQNNKAIILFDGVCNLCNSSVEFVLNHDKKEMFRFASIQSEIGNGFLKRYNIDRSLTDSIIIIENENAYTRSTAALRIAKHLGGVYSLLYLFIIVPPFIRNAVYDFIAKNRYKWFGKQESCMVPTDELKKKFIS
jgi:predicted DCC family thiol-disulfide oxidoreductase YuxK